jgi:hypothetical protein
MDAEAAARDHFGKGDALRRQPAQLVSDDDPRPGAFVEDLMGNIPMYEIK